MSPWRRWYLEDEERRMKETTKTSLARSQSTSSRGTLLRQALAHEVVELDNAYRW